MCQWYENITDTNGLLAQLIRAAVNGINFRQ